MFTKRWTDKDQQFCLTMYKMIKIWKKASSEIERNASHLTWNMEAKWFKDSQIKQASEFLLAWIRNNYKWKMKKNQLASYEKRRWKWNNQISKVKEGHVGNKFAFDYNHGFKEIIVRLFSSWCVCVLALLFLSGWTRFEWTTKNGNK